MTVINQESVPMPCPFCGSESVLHGKDWVQCQSCGATIECDDCEHMKKWNRRDLFSEDLEGGEYETMSRWAVQGLIG